MAQPQHQYPPRSFSPVQSASSPHHGTFLPPNKRQRLSPNPQSPYNSPSMSNIALPNQVFSSPYYGAQPNGIQPTNSYNTMNAPPPAGNMGPPSRPAAEKPADVNELNDVLIGSGIDIRDEEAALLNHHNSYPQQPDTSFGSNYSNPYDSFGSNASGPDRYNVMSQNVPGDRNSFYGAGTFNQPAATYQPTAQQAETEKQAAIRRKAETRQYHLNNPFLYAGCVQRRLSKQSHAQQVTVPNFGVLQSKESRPVQVAVAGPDKHERIVSLTGQDLMWQDVPLAEILTLMSLAAEERLRALVEDAAALAKGRRIGSHGVVPTDLTDLAIGDGPFETVNALPTPSNSAVSPKSNPLKRMLNFNWLARFTMLMKLQVRMLPRINLQRPPRMVVIVLLPPLLFRIPLLKLFEKLHKKNEQQSKRDLRNALADPQLVLYPPSLDPRALPLLGWAC